jgi:hypothetical protein
MARASKLPAVLMGAGAVLLLRQAAKGVYRSQVTEEVLRQRDRLFEVSETCEISLKEPSDGGGGEGLERSLELMWTEFIEPIVHGSWSDGRWTLADLTTDVMDRLFPEVQCTWPPPTTAAPSQKLAFYVVRNIIAEGLSCDPDAPEAALPEGQVCVVEEVNPAAQAFIQSAKAMISLLYPGVAEFGESFDGNAPTSGYRAPADLVEGDRG